MSKSESNEAPAVQPPQQGREEAPERIWVEQPPYDGEAAYVDKVGTFAGDKGFVEYVRADLVPQLNQEEKESVETQKTTPCHPSNNPERGQDSPASCPKCGLEGVSVGKRFECEPCNWEWEPDSATSLPTSHNLRTCHVPECVECQKIALGGEVNHEECHNALAFIVALDNQPASVIREYAQGTLNKCLSPPTTSGAEALATTEESQGSLQH